MWHNKQSATVQHYAIDDTISMVINANTEVHSSIVGKKQTNKQKRKTKTKSKHDCIAFSEVNSNIIFVISLKYELPHLDSCLQFLTKLH